MPMISCRVLGTPELLVDGAPPPAELMWRKNLALLVYLARSPRRTRTREHLMGLFWADKPETAARHSLREAIRVLRRTVGEEHLVTEHDRVTLGDGIVQLDADVFAGHEEQHRWRDAADLVGGDFLEGFGVPDASAFEDWLIAERDEWRRRAVRTLTAHAEELLDAGRLDESVSAAQRALKLDPGADGAARAAMQALTLAGDRAGALACYKRLCERLGELGGTPDRDTELLAERVRQERTWRLSDEVPVDATLGAEVRRAPLVGREGQLTRLVEILEQCRHERRAAACVLQAVPGLGKSRLAEELLTRARLTGAAVSAVRAVEGDLDAPWTGVLGLARGGLIDAPGLAAAAPSALSAFAAELPEWADRFGTRGATAPLGPAFVEALRAVSEEQPVVLLADDAHWLDGESLRTLIQATRDLHQAPLLAVFAAQEDPSRPELEDLRSRLGRDLPGTAMHLAPLDDAAIRELVGWAMPAYPEPDAERLVRRIAADSAGLPLLAIELLHAVALGLDVGAVAGTWPAPYKTLDQTLPSELPDTIVAAIRVGFRRLSADAQRVLVAAAVLGGRQPANVLGRAAGLSGVALDMALDELEWQRWLSADGRGYGFVARVARDVVDRDMVIEGQRQRIRHAV
jgi:DNA-binding SARP family transcriptional activator